MTIFLIIILIVVAVLAEVVLVRWQLSKITKAYLQRHPEILIEQLPAYAPQLNPEEYCHGNVKQRLKNARPESREEIRSLLDHGFTRIRRRPDLLLGFFHNAGLSVRQLWLT